MDELLQQLSANDFAMIEGLQVTGTLPVRQDIINELLTDLLQKQQAGVSTDNAAPASSPTPSSPSKPAAAKINWAKLVSKLQVQLKEGKLVVDFELRR